MTSIERYIPPPNPVLADDRYMNQLETRAAMFAKSNLCPEAFRGKPADVAIVGLGLADLGLRLTVNTLPHAYVVHGQLKFDSQLQTAVAARYGYKIDPVDEECNDKQGVVRIVNTGTGESHRVTFTIDDAKKADLVKAGGMYTKWPVNMLVARATTRAIKWHAGEVMLGMGEAGAPVEFGGMDEVDAADAPVGHEPVGFQQDPDPAATELQIATEEYGEAFKALDQGDRPTAIDQLKTEKIPPVNHPDLTAAQALRGAEICRDVAQGITDAEVIPEAPAYADGEEPFFPDAGQAALDDFDAQTGGRS